MRVLIYLLSIFILFSCEGSSNAEVAHIYTQGDITIIELTGKRRGMVHNPEIPKIYRDTFLLKFKGRKTLTPGEDCIVEPGYYSYTGHIELKKDSVVISLFANNTDDKTLDPISYNGAYLLKIKK